MKVSVIVTTYNNPGALSKVLEGFSLQSSLPDEVIVADDGSGPETAGLVERTKEESALAIEHVWQEDLGFRLARIRNEAIRRARGEYLIIMDGDCVPNRHYVADHLALAERGHFVQGKRVLLDSEASEGFDAHRANSIAGLLRDLAGGHLGNAHHLLRMPGFPALRSRKLKGIKGCNTAFFKDDAYAV
ncbi:MAG: glycosyltransferase, partial [Nitrospirota bacterium]